jgi:signal transduction histidine kinase
MGSRFADLGRIEWWLRALGLILWAFVGASRLPPRIGQPGFALACALWAGYGAAFLAASLHARIGIWPARACLAVQSIAVLLMPTFELKGFEGMLLSFVVAQAPLVWSFRGSAAFATAQAVPLVLVVWPFHIGREVLEILGAYSTFSAFTLLVYWLHQQEWDRRRELARSNAELLATRALLVENSRQAERLRIARDLHDSLGHHLTALNIQLALAEKLNGDGDAVRKAHGLSRDALAEVRNVVTAMRASDEVDVALELKALASRIISPRIHLALDDQITRDADVAQTVLRCAQEAITNALRHASAQNIWVAVSSDARGVHLRVHDDGKGVPAITPGHGLQGMRERAARVEGAVELTSRPGGGFDVSVHIPGRSA